MVVLFFLNACNQGNVATNHLPGDGEVCFKADEKGSEEYIHMSIHGNHVEGRIFLVEEVNGEVFYRFNGTVISDTLLKLNVSYLPDDLPQNWSIRFNSGVLQVTNSLNRKETINYKRIDCSNMPDTTAYDSVHEIAREEQAEYTENNRSEISGGSMCFESSYASYGAHQRIKLHEYIQLESSGNVVRGKGAGESEGDSWAYTFSGFIENDSILKLEVKYEQKNKANFTNSETWIMSRSTTDINFKSSSATHPGAIKYKKIQCNDVQEYYLELFQDMK